MWIYVNVVESVFSRRFFLTSNKYHKGEVEREPTTTSNGQSD